MFMHWREIASLLGVAWLTFFSSTSFDSRDYAAEDVITRDVCIIGGGGSGTYAAIRLQDMGKSVIVVEAKGRLGGHTQTYVDPTTHTTVDYGVQNWIDLDVVRNYFTRLNVSFTKVYPFTSSVQGVREYIDFTIGEKVIGWETPDPEAALKNYIAHLEKYPYLSNGFDFPTPVPEDLLLPFGKFVSKYGLEDIVNFIFVYGEGLGDLLETPTIYVMKRVGLEQLQGFEVGELTTSSHDNSEVYDKAVEVLGANVLLSSHVAATDRQSNATYVKIVVNTPTGFKLIQAKKLIVSIPPIINNLAGFDLTQQESTLFGQFSGSALYAALIRDTGIPNQTYVISIAADNINYNLPYLPGIYQMGPTSVPGLQYVYFGSCEEMTDQQVQREILGALGRFQMSSSKPFTKPSFAAFANHAPFALKVPASAIASGFYGELHGLQGKSRTYYTGAAFHTQDSGLLWQFTEGLLPNIAS